MGKGRGLMKFRKPKTMFCKRTLSIVMTTLIVTGLMGSGSWLVNAEGKVTFKTQSGGIFDGMPLFDGVPAHLDEYVDTYYDYIGLEGAALYATGIRDNYTFVWDKNPNKGKTVPGGLAAADNVQGISTDFPAIVAMGQSWNKDLMTSIGEVMGSEKISQLNVKQGTANIHNGTNASKPIAFTVLSDLRVNPLSGRFDEGYSEDPYFSSVAIDKMASGLSGTNMNGNEDGFWIRAVVGTKHYSNYNAQWYRTSANNSAGARAIYEYQTRSALKGLASGSVSGVMTSFGRTNGIPNIISPFMIYANNVAKYGLYSSPDFNGENHLYGTSFANEYDSSYVPDRQHALALMVLAHSESVRASGTDKTDVITLVNAAEKGLYGITLKDVQEAGRPLVNQLARIGIFNEVDEKGIPKNYPFAQYAKDVTNPANLTNYKTQAHQDVELQAAQESIVLLKNDGALPLSKNAKGVVSGIYANTRFKTQYSVGTTPKDIPDSGITPLNAIVKAVSNKNDLAYSSGTKVIAFKSKLNGKFVTASAGDGGQLAASYDGSSSLTNAQLFDVYDWGQEGYSLFSKINNRWVTSPNANAAAVANNNTTALAVADNSWDNIDIYGTSSSLPPVLRTVKNSDGSISIAANTFATGFSSVFAESFYTSGRFISVDNNGNLATASQILKDTAGVAKSENLKFEEIVVKEEGSDVVSYADAKDYAIVFIGANVKHSASEGKDRSTLRMGESDYKLVKNVSAAFAAKGKKTIVVVETNFPVIMDEIQNNPNVNAIVYQPYGGQYDAKALAQVLYGDYAPTGRMTATWYADMSALQPISQYSLPLGNNTLTLASIDPRYTKDMTNADPVEQKLTYMYTDSAVTYDFGYGLSYSSFTYKNLNLPNKVSSSGKFEVTVDVTNTGKVNTSEVVQLYVKNNKSAYGSYAPKQQLVSFEKVYVPAGQTKKVTLTVEPQDFAIWDVNKGELVVEAGTYTVMVGHSSKDIRGTKTVNVSGTEIAKLESNQEISVFDHSFASNGVVYREVSKQNTIDSLKADEVVGGYYAVMSKEKGSWVAIPKVDLSKVKSVRVKVATNKAPGTISLHANNMNTEPFATINVPVTEKVTTNIQGGTGTMNELGYVYVDVDIISARPSSVHDVYVVFGDADLRIDSITFEK
jgi:beta-glucosidase